MGIIKWMAMLLLMEIMALAHVNGSRVPGNGSFSRENKSIQVQKMNSHHLSSKSAVIKSIQSEDGDIIECIDIHKQPAFDHPALRNHKIQLFPSYVPTEGKIVKKEGEFGSKEMKQVWQKSGSCPNGTVPIRKMKGNIQNKATYGRKPPYYSLKLHHHEDNKEIRFLYKNRSVAILHAEGFAYYGAKGSILICSPWVEFDNEYTTSQVSLKSGDDDNFESMESGWAVNPSVYGDRLTRFFVYWTVDGSKKTGCFDQTCPGFVQTSSEIALGATIDPMSTNGTHPSDVAVDIEMNIYIFKDALTGNWWVQNDDKVIGYWPGELFSLMRAHAETVQWGGEVYSNKVGVHPHTGTAMGSGSYAMPPFGSSGSVRRIRVVVGTKVIKFPDFVNSYSDEYDCYDTFYNHEYMQDPEFYYGGPGRNWKCP